MGTVKKSKNIIGSIIASLVIYLGVNAFHGLILFLFGTAKYFADILDTSDGVRTYGHYMMLNLELMMYVVFISTLIILTVSIWSYYDTKSR